MTSNAENSTGLKEDSKLTKVIGLMACGALASASLWLFNMSQAQDQQLTGAPPRQATSSAAEWPAGLDAGDPFASQASEFQPAQSEPLAGEQTVIRKRIDDELRLAQKAKSEGRPEEALRRATSARDLATRFQISFGADELKPGDLIAELTTVASKPPVANQEEQARYAQYLIRAAREDLKAGRTQKAFEKAKTAQSLNATYGPFDDRPEHVLADVARRQTQGQMLAGNTTNNDAAPAAPRVGIDPTSEQSAKQQSQSLLAAAEKAVQEGRYDEARKLAGQADQLPVTYSLFDRRPEQILALIERASDSRMIVASEQKPQQASQAPVATTVPEMPVSPEPKVETAAAQHRNQALNLLAEARDAVSRGDLATANQKVSQAQQFDVTYTLFDDRPELIMAEINAVQKQQMLAQQQPAAAPAIGTVQAPPIEAARAPMAGNTVAAKTAAQNTLAQNTAAPKDMTPAATAQPTAANNPAKSQAHALLAQSREALSKGEYELAREKARQAMQYDVTYDVFDVRPQQILAEIDRRGGSPANPGTMLAQSDVTPIEAEMPAEQSVQSTGIVTASNGANQAELSGVEAYSEGVQLLRNGEREAARQVFLVAFQKQDELNSVQKQQLQDVLRQLSVKRDDSIQMVNNQVYDEEVTKPEGSQRIDLVRQQQSIEYDRLRSETFNTVYQAERLRESDPVKALELIDTAMNKLAETNLSEDMTKSLAAQLRRSRSSIEKYKSQREPLIALEKRNEEVRSQIEQERKLRIRIEQDLADMTEEFNRLMREHRYPEAEIVAKKAKELAPEEAVTEMMVWKAKFARRIAVNEEIANGKEENFIDTLVEVDRGMLNPVVKDSIAYQDAKAWDALTKNRKQFGGPDNRQRTAEELEIIDSLNQPISLHFDNEPLSEVFRQVAMMADINIWTDEQGLEEVGASSNTPVTMHIDGIKLKSALNLLLEPYGLAYNIDDDVLKVTSTLRMQGELVPAVYNVADLVVPLPVMAGQFGAGSGLLGGAPGMGGGQMSMPNQPFGNSMGQISDPLAMAGAGNPMGGTDGILGAPGSRTARNQSADFDGLSELITSVVRPESWDTLGGNGVVKTNASTLSLVIRQTQAVHDEIAELLKQLRRLQDLQVTIEVRFITVSDRFFERIGIDFDFNVQDTIGGPETDEDGIPLPPFGTVDTLGSGGNNNGGNNNNNGGNNQNQQGQQGQSLGLFDPSPVLNLVNRDRYQSGGTIVGMNSPDSFSQDLDIPFRQGSFQVGVPDFGNFNPEVGIQVGFAVLSDIEAFFFIQAAQADERSNIMFAPKVTLFNGQIASVNDQVQRPFVISVTPSVSVFNVGFQPQISFISEGVSLTVQAVISADRRYVRLSVLPTFTNITDVQTFTVQGGIGGQGGGAGGIGGQGGFGGQGGGFGGQGGGGFGGGGFGGQQGFGGIGGVAGGGAGGGIGGQGGQGGGQIGGGQQGGNVGAGSITLQQPIQEQVFVQTVVSVPDGGTVLLGGVKRLREGRNMAGVPILNKIPYVSRLFKNTGVGRETESLMLMVTPRIIIQEEEEQLLGVELD
uniref:Type II and III secretion system protein n=2 Tax=Rubinisphaera brasiliensis TaxID=119 RepID=F0SHL8_RUBBR|nr:type II and III secretion system protein [Rubinisphaera brasiliensis DSM 5305]